MKYYAEMTVYELEQKRNKLEEEMMRTDNEAMIELLSVEIDYITDEIDSRDPLEDE